MDRPSAVEPAASLFSEKAKIRRVIEAEGIPRTYVCSNAFASFFLGTIGKPNVTAPPRDKVVILGDGNVKGNNLITNRFFSLFTSTNHRNATQLSQVLCLIYLFQGFMSLRKM